MKRSLVVLLHLGFWGCFLVLTMVVLGVLYGSSEDVPDGAIEYTFLTIFYFAWIPSAITFNGFYFFLFPRFVKKRKYGKAILGGGSIALAGACLGFYLLSYHYPEECVRSSGLTAKFWGILSMTFVASVSGILALVIQGFLTWMEEIKLKDQLKQQNQEMEMALLKSKLDPHFLFNTLNNIDVLILKNAQKASDYLNKLSEIMRFTLFETRTAEIPLVKEIEYIEKYIALQKIRTANNQYVKFEVIGNPKDKSIAPMVFIPFIENAFKHTTNKKAKDAIQIKIYIEADSIKLECNNKIEMEYGRANQTAIPRDFKNNSSGLGNQLIQKRLTLLYPNSHILNIFRQPQLYSVQLTIQDA